MTITYFSIFVYFLGICSFGKNVKAAHTFKLRLRNGPTQYEGLLEVYHNYSWGTVCDDNWQDSYCAVVCRQLGFSGGKLIDGSKYGVNTSMPIWLDDVVCTGLETALDQCMMSHKHNCDHTEDVACRCAAPVFTPMRTSCDPNLYRIRMLSADYPWIGRAETRTSPTGDWHVICDDYWSDLNAEVFCTCLGYTGPFHAYSAVEIGAMLPNLDMAYDWVKCSKENIGENLQQCSHAMSTGKCLPAEAAGVACGELRHTPLPHAPNASLTCNSKQITTCYTGSQYSMSSQYLSLTPPCAKAKRYDIKDGVCYDIDMKECKAAQLESDKDYKHYCYDVSYSQYDDDPETLIMDAVWNKRACCSVFKNGTVQSDFSPLSCIGCDGPDILARTLYRMSEEKVKFDISCYQDSDFRSTPLSASDMVIRGQEVYCKVTTDVWDSDLLLVVPECQFGIEDPQSPDSLGKPAFSFISNKCPTTTELDLSYFNFDAHSWGFKFEVPRFQGYSQLYLTCGTYVCDERLDPKPYCDRSCVTSKRKIRDLSNTPTKVAKIINDRVSLGPFQIIDEGFGPLIHFSTDMKRSQFPHDVKSVTKDTLKPFQGHIVKQLNKTVVQTFPRSSKSSTLSSYPAVLLLSYLLNSLLNVM